MGFVVALTMITGALMFRVAGLGISAALSPFQQSGGAAQITPTGSTGIPTRTPTAIAGAATAIATTVAGASTPASIPGQRPAAAPTTLAGTPAPGQPPAGATPARTVVATTPAPGVEALSLAGTGISLQSLIAQHLKQDGQQESTGEEAKTNPPQTQKAIGFQSAWVSGHSNYEQSAYGKANNATAGRRLNATDTTWAAGIEHLLPTPLFRLRVTKERLVREREALESALAQAQQLQRLQPHVDHGPSSYNSPFYQAEPSTQKQSLPSASQLRIRTLQERLLNIRRHETHVDYQLRQSMPAHQQWLFTLLDGWQGTQRQLEKWQQRLTQLVSVEAWIRKLDPTRLALSQTNQHLRDVEQLLSQSSQASSLEHPKSASPETLVECITLYDRLTAEAEHFQAELTQRPSWLKRAWKKLFQAR
jgi:hypothetical protein